MKVTARAISPNPHAMLRRMSFLLLLLLASSLVTTAAVHAREWSGPVTIECSGTVHGDGDEDQSPGDSDKGVPHHHGTCHAQALTLPVTDELTVFGRRAAPPFALATAALASAATDPALRPPTA